MEAPLISALFKALGQFDDPRILAVIGKSVGLAILLFVLLGAGLWELAGWIAAGLSHWIGWLAHFGTVILAIGLAWFLFPAVITMFVGFFVEAIASAVEARHYPGRPPARQQSFAAIVGTGLRFGAVALFLNLILLPAYLLMLLFPPLYLLVFYWVNGYLLGRAYFELVAYRRLDERAADALRRARSGQVTLAGVMIALMLTIPVFNLFAPIAATAFALHLFEAMPKATA
ncbi:MAG TPA: EI24 domain-containing protein [Candidatus Udaeobacter sp.]|nr:EI24 domain-containing protein [Candidatus Udaeobacter sp.]